MRWQSGLAIFTLFWVLSAFVVMPFGVRTHDEAGADKVPGQAESAPFNFQPWKIVKRTTIVASIAFAVFLANYTYGWVTPDMLDVFTPRELRAE